MATHLVRTFMLLHAEDISRHGAPFAATGAILTPIIPIGVKDTLAAGTKPTAGNVTWVEKEAASDESGLVPEYVMNACLSSGSAGTP